MTPNAHGGKTRQLRFQTRTQDKTNPEWLTFTTIKRLSFKALQTSGTLFADFILRRRSRETSISSLCKNCRHRRALI